VRILVSFDEIYLLGNNVSIAVSTHLVTTQLAMSAPRVASVLLIPAAARP
jgi:hypothetical protein